MAYISHFPQSNWNVPPECFKKEKPGRQQNPKALLVVENKIEFYCKRETL